MFKKGLLWIFGGLIFNLGETAFFGWNMKAQSFAEGFCDNIAAIGILIGLCTILGYAIGKTVTVTRTDGGGEDARE